MNDHILDEAELMAIRIDELTRQNKIMLAALDEIYRAAPSNTWIEEVSCDALKEVYNG